MPETKITVFATASWFLLTLTASATPIAVTGGGSFETSNSDSEYAIWFSGSDGLGSVSANGTCAYMTGCRPSDGIGAYIDGVHFSPGFFSFGLGEGGGWLVGFDSTRSQIVMRENLSSWEEITSMACGPAAGLVAMSDCRGSLAVMGTDPSQGHGVEAGTVAPDPSGLGIVGLLLGGLALRLRARRLPV